MKKSILLISCLFLLGSISHAQTKTDTTKKVVQKPAPVYSPNLVKPYDFILPGLTIQQVNDYLYYAKVGPAIDDQTDISAKQAKDIKANAAIVIEAIAKKFNDILADDKIKWQVKQADSLKAAQSKSPKTK